MDNILSIGSIIVVSGVKFCVIGFSSIEKNNETVCGYYVVTYPVGYVALDRLLFIPLDADFEILSEGYKNSESEGYLNVLKNAFDNVNKYTKDQLETYVNTMKNALDKENLK